MNLAQFVTLFMWIVAVAVVWIVLREDDGI
jgi:cbb3-type cytochrome oxidase subunit 3